MIRTFCLRWIASLLFAGGVCSPLVAEESPFDQDPFLGGSLLSGNPSVTASAEFTVDTKTRTGRLAITATIADGQHIYAITQRPGGPTPSEIRLGPSDEFKVLDEFEPIEPPKSHVGTTFFKGMTLEEHEGTVTWIAPIELHAGVSAEEMTVRGEFYAQACTSRNCFPPRLYPFEAKFVSKLSIPRPQRMAATENGDEAADRFLSDAFAPELESSDNRSLAFMLGSAFFGGLILNLMPCVLPVIGLKILSFLEQSGHDRRRAGTRLVFWLSSSHWPLSLSLRG